MTNLESGNKAMQEEQYAHKTRPCVIEDGAFREDAVFHRWVDGGREALVEFRDGMLNRVPVEKVTFVDGGDFDLFTYPDK